MTSEFKTTFSNRCAILADVWLNYRDDEQFMDFVTYNDVGLPLAYILDTNIVKVTDIAEKFIDETWALLIAGLGIEDLGFENIDEMLDEADKLN